MIPPHLVPAAEAYKEALRQQQIQEAATRPLVDLGNGPGQPPAPHPNPTPQTRPLVPKPKFPKIPRPRVPSGLGGKAVPILGAGLTAVDLADRLPKVPGQARDGVAAALGAQEAIAAKIREPFGLPTFYPYPWLPPPGGGTPAGYETPYDSPMPSNPAWKGPVWDYPVSPGTVVRIRFTGSLRRATCPYWCSYSNQSFTDYELGTVTGPFTIAIYSNGQSGDSERQRLFIKPVGASGNGSEVFPSSGYTSNVRFSNYNFSLQRVSDGTPIPTRPKPPTPRPSPGATPASPQTRPPARSTGGQP
ncbi:hypothetical protein L3556_06395 [Candidatus Synechococcus calcipolaris G9]|uniref:Uncharacterized protein n=1 Tax=Candidatus Synechococcus calcipolaris G9 TaxID=1497997 RepID=A0ABT6EXN9_9SYNE|nr:hypothetical protein [Candidatus Synechococcus calcipolaris]MDG2990565.1 hypothetical protein [Candidatus Synechococcus calcipolaris G9]